jgi:hypothetical protein
MGAPGLPDPRLLGVSVREYRELEAGAQFPSSDTWDRMCDLYGWSQSFVRRRTCEGPKDWATRPAACFHRGSSRGPLLTVPPGRWGSKGSHTPVVVCLRQLAGEGATARIHTLGPGSSPTMYRLVDTIRVKRPSGSTGPQLVVTVLDSRHATLEGHAPSFTGEESAAMETPRDARPRPRRCKK